VRSWTGGRMLDNLSWRSTRLKPVGQPKPKAGGSLRDGWQSHVSDMMPGIRRRGKRSDSQRHRAADGLTWFYKLNGRRAAAGREKGRVHQFGPIRALPEC